MKRPILGPALWLLFLLPAPVLAQANAIDLAPLPQGSAASIAAFLQPFLDLTLAALTAAGAWLTAWLTPALVKLVGTVRAKWLTDHAITIYDRALASAASYAGKTVGQLRDADLDDARDYLYRHYAGWIARNKLSSSALSEALGASLAQAKSDATAFAPSPPAAARPEEFGAGGDLSALKAENQKLAEDLGRARTENANLAAKLESARAAIAA